MNSRRATTSLALIVLICFFLPWVQVSCGASQDRLAGIDLARDGHGELWLIPLLMIAVLSLTVARKWRETRSVSALVTLIAGIVSAYLMNRERLRAENHSSLIAVNLTGWFWVGLGSTIVLTLLAVLSFLKRPRST
jgi:hypothetical protein